MANFSLKKGHNIKISGEPEKSLVLAKSPNKIYLHPRDFSGVKPKLLVKQDDVVSVGSPIFFDKMNPAVKFVSPVSGTISEIKFGKRRVIEQVVVKSNVELNKDKSESKITSAKTNAPNSLNLANLTADELKFKLAEGGLWPCIRQRPFSKIANIDQIPRNIFVSVYSTAPFAIDNAFALEGRESNFQIGLDILSKLEILWRVIAFII